MQYVPVLIASLKFKSSMQSLMGKQKLITTKEGLEIWGLLGSVCVLSQTNSMKVIERLSCFAGEGKLQVPTPPPPRCKNSVTSGY